MLNGKFLMALPLAALVAGVSMHAPAHAQVAVRDPQTGQLRAPTAAEHKALTATGGSAAMHAPAPMSQLSTQPMVKKDGSRGVSLDERSQVYEVVTRGPDGKLTQQCVHGEAAAKRAATQPATQQKEPRHEDR